MDERLAEAFINREHTVLGRKLKPFYVWHGFALRLIDSPFCGDRLAPFNFTHLYLAVEICSRGYDPRLAALHKGRWFRLKFWLRHRGWKKRFDAELEAFTAYLRDYRSGPNPKLFWDSDEPASGLEPELTLVGRLIRNGGMTEREAWETPEGKAIWLAIALLEAGGGRSNYMNQSDLAAMRAAGWIE